MKRSLASKIAIGTAAAAMSLGAVACDAEVDDLDGGDDTMEDDGLGDEDL
jgi:hypothetical protein